MIKFLQENTGYSSRRLIAVWAMILITGMLIKYSIHPDPSDQIIIGSLTLIASVGTGASAIPKKP